MQQKKLHLFINKKCNLNCRYCYWPSHPDEEMDDATINKIIDYIKGNPDKYDYIVFFGGEPMLSYKIIAKFILGIGKNMNYVVMTNGTVHPKNLLDIINDDFGYNICFTFSFDGLYQTDRSKNAVDKIMKHMEYLRRTKRAAYTVGCILSPYHHNLIIDNMIDAMNYTDSAIFFRICNLAKEWPNDKLEEHIKDFRKIVDIATYYTVCKEKNVWLSNRIDKKAEDEHNNLNGAKGNTCQKSLVHTDVCGIDGKKYLCEPAYALGGRTFGYIWDPEDTTAIAWNSSEQHQRTQYHHCLFYNNCNVKYENAMIKMRNKYHERKQKLEKLKQAKYDYLMSLDKKGRLLRLARDYYRNK